MTRQPTAVLLIVAACGLAYAAAPASKPPPAPRAGSLELVVLGDDRLARIELRVEVEGRPVPEIWDKTFGQLFAYHDRDGDGRLDKKEAARLPSAFGLRQVLWGQSAPPSGPPVPWKELDRDGDGKVTRDDLAGFYRRGGVGNVFVGVGRPRATAALTAALLKNLDTDGDGAMSEAEWKAASALSKLDRNDDELIGPGELVPRTAYPGVVGAVLLRPPAAADKEVPELDGLPFVLLPDDAGDTHWASVVVTRRDRDKDGKLDAKEAGLPVDVFAGLDADGDGKLSPAELAAWRKGKPDARYVIRLGKDATVEGLGGWAAFAAGRLRLEVRADQGKMPEAMAAARKRFLDRFADADANADGFLEEKEVNKRNQYELEQLLVVADRDGDGKLSKKELTAWLDLQDQIASGQVLLTLLDHGAGLFELLDADHDGSLSVPELRRAWERIKESGCLAGGKFDQALLPRQVIVTASQGHPVHPLGPVRKAGPAWFRAMDRNGDGYVSRREFTSTKEQFDALDADKNGFISSEEAERAKP